MALEIRRRLFPTYIISVNRALDLPETENTVKPQAVDSWLFSGQIIDDTYNQTYKLASIDVHMFDHSVLWEQSHLCAFVRVYSKLQLCVLWERERDGSYVFLCSPFPTTARGCVTQLPSLADQQGQTYHYSRITLSVCILLFLSAHTSNTSDSLAVRGWAST